MPTYISLLRGINVSGQKAIRMEDLRSIYESLGFSDVRTYVQSGNVVFSSSNKAADIERKIESAILKSYGFDVPVVVLDGGRLAEIVNNNPFSGDKSRDRAYFHVTFLATNPDQVNMDLISEKMGEGEDIRYKNGAFYLYCPNGYGKTKLNNNFLESKTGLRATTRNWKSVNELLRMAKE